jgi:hypothetical protein
VLVVAVVGLLALRLTRETGCSEFSLERTSITAEGLTINVMPEALVGSFGVKLSSVPLAEFSHNAADSIRKNADKNADLSVAAAALPASLTPQSNFIIIKTCSVAPKFATLRVSVPADVPSLDGIDMYSWDGTLRQWQWVGGEIDRAAREIVAQVTWMPSSLMLMKTAPTPPVIGMEMSPASPIGGETAAPPSAQQTLRGIVEVSSPGLYLGDFGNIAGDRSRALVPAGLNAATTPVIRNWGENGEVNRTLLRDMLSNESARDAHIANLVSLTEVGGYGGIELDYRGVAPEQRNQYTRFIELLVHKLAARNKTLTVSVPAPTGARSGETPTFDLPGYDLRALGRAASQIKLDLSASPSALWSDDLGEVIRWATGQIDRYKLQLVLPSLSVKQDVNGRTALIGFEEALKGLGALQVDEAVVRPGAKLKLSWRSSVNPAGLHYYPDAGVFCYTYVDGRGIQQTVWLSTAASLKHVLERVGEHNLRGVTIRGLGRSDDDADDRESILRILDAFADGDLASASAPDPHIKIKFSSERYNKELPLVLSTKPGSTWFEVEAPKDDGEYDILAYFDSVKEVPIGRAPLRVSKEAEPSAGEDQDPALAESPSVVSATVQSNAAAQTPQLSTVGSPQSNAAATTFELGGHVWDLNHVAQMKGAGMTWVKTEARNFDLPSDFIANAKARDMKVLVTAVGDRAQVMDEAYREQWTQHLAKLAAAGVDAIEVWNEPNLDTEWPTGQINGANYAGLLKKAYAAIKAASPNTLVISAGLAQTNGLFGGACSTNGCDDSAFLAQMASAGAKDGLDCIGAHYTSGSTAPGETTGSLGGSHYSWYYQPLRDTYLSAFGNERPICFTALGYVSAAGFKGGMPSNYAFADSTTLDHHARWLAEAAKLSRESGKVRLMIVWNVDSDYWQPGDPQAGYAMIRPDGTCPACETLWSVMGSQ